MGKINRVAVIVLDGVGVGEQEDSKKYGDAGANTFRHVYESMKPDIGNLEELGMLGAAGYKVDSEEPPIGCYGRMREVSSGKDTTSGHWEIAGLQVDKPFPTFPNGFPKELIDRFEEETGFGVIGNKAASGTAIIEELGAEHMKTGKLIVYTSADSVFQIAAHEGIIPESELWHICRVARKLLTGEYGVGRVIARPFIGAPGGFVRTGNRKDFSVDPTGRTMLDVLSNEGYDVIGVGKIEDIFNHRGLTRSVHSVGNEECIDTTIELLKKKNWRGLLFTNLVDTDSKYGHRNDPAGFAKALEYFDGKLPEILKALGDDGMLIITADHGCDPCDVSTDHTREFVPLLVYGLNLKEGVDLGTRGTFADVSATVLEALGTKEKLAGESFYGLINED